MDASLLNTPLSIQSPQYLSSRLKNAALSWSAKRADSHHREGYRPWRAAFLLKFTRKGDIDRLILKLDTIKMKETHTTQYVDKILSLHNLIYGDSEENLTEKTLKNDYLLRVFMRGLRPKIRDAMYARLPAKYDWNIATQAAIDAEDLLDNKQIKYPKIDFDQPWSPPRPFLTSEIAALAGQSYLQAVEKHFWEFLPK